MAEMVRHAFKFVLIFVQFRTRIIYQYTQSSKYIPLDIYKNTIIFIMHFYKNKECPENVKDACAPYYAYRNTALKWLNHSSRHFRSANHLR